jgi:glycosyltransferase involved in cell wall biosynthesis
VKLILVAFSYPPDPMVGAFRPAKVARAFASSGYRVEVLTGRIAADQESGRPSSPGVSVHALRWIANPRHVYLWLKRLVHKFLRRPPAATLAPAAGPSSGEPHSAPGGLRQFVISMLWLPDENQGFILPAVMRGLSLLREGHGVIYTTAPPFSDHLVGLVLKWLTGRPWVMELRDPWADSKRAVNMRSRPVAAANRWLEERCLHAADLVVAVSKPVHDSLARRMGPTGETRLFLALNGIDAIRERLPDRSCDSPFLIVHTGSLYNDPRPFLRAVASVARRMEIGPKELTIEFIGQEPYFVKPTVQELAQELGLSGMVSFSGWIPQEECRLRIAEADLLLLLCEGFPTAIPNKLFDYLGARTPILGIVDVDGQSANVLRDQQDHFVTTSADMAQVERALERAYRERTARQRLVNNGQFLHEWSTEHQLQHLVERVGALDRNAPVPSGPEPRRHAAIQRQEP